MCWPPKPQAGIVSSAAARPHVQPGNLPQSVQDIMARYQRMRGRSVLWLPGTDHAGIATQMVVEKSLEAQGIKRKDLGREAFVDKVWEWKREYGGFITQQLRSLGASCDWSREAFTLDANLSGAHSPGGAWI